MENKFCFLKGLVECESGVIQNCNDMRTSSCPLEQPEAKKEKPAEKGFCFLKGLVDCNPGILQDCNIKRVAVCPKE